MDSVSAFEKIGQASMLYARWETQDGSLVDIEEEMSLLVPLERPSAGTSLRYPFSVLSFSFSSSESTPRRR
jgi:hypothetical protein